MKKKILAAASLVLPVCMLCACGGTVSVPVTAYWYKDSATGGNMLGENREEKLTYSVTFEPNTAATGVTLSYETGVYTTRLSATSKDDDGNAFEDTVYRYETKLDIRGSYSLNGVKGPDFDDSVRSVIYFKGIGNSLRPVKSIKSVKCHAPNNGAEDAEHASVFYDYTYSTAYESDGKKITATYTQTSPADAEGQPYAPDVKEISLKDATNYYDNEQLLFVLRGMSMDSAFTLKTLNPLSGQVESVKSVDVPTPVTEADFKMNIGGEDMTNSIAAYRFDLQYGTATPGQAQTLTYAKTTDKGNNRFRNVLLRMSVPVISDLGTLNYTLVSAVFAE